MMDLLPCRKLAQRRRVAYPTLTWVCQRPSRLIAFGFGSGLLRPASGTWGTLLAWLIWRVCVQGGCELTGLRDAGLQGAKLYDIFLGFFLVATFIYGCWACHRVGKELNQADHVGMVWDEIVAFWLVLWLIPAGWSTQLCAFLLFRWFDIVKPAPIRYVEARVKGGIGVMLDDLLAAGYTLLGITIAVRLGVFQ